MTEKDNTGLSLLEPQWGYTREAYLEDLSGFDNTAADAYVLLADEIMDGCLYVSDQFPGMPYQSPEELNWFPSYSDSPNTFLLYLQGLTPVQVLAKAYQESGGELAYLERAEAFLDSWIAYSQTEEAKSNSRMWNDHGVAIRGESILYLAISAEGSALDTPQFRQKMNDSLIQHAQWLAEDGNYTANHNHGIIQDCALIRIAYFLDSPEKESWIQLGKERLNTQKKFAFNEEMIHVENSAGYNVGVIEFFYKISQFLLKVGDPAGNTLSEDIHSAAEFLGWITMPNGVAAPTGDSDSSRHGNARLNFASSLGEFDEMTPDEKAKTTKYYPRGGYWFYRQSWNADNATDSTWKMFKAGYSSGTHKHSDDCSFMLYSRGYEIFSDCGWYNYMSGDPMRDYLVSSSAHNTITVNERSYSVMAESADKTGMLACESSEQMDHVLAFNNMYLDTEIDRHVYSSGDLTVLFDDIVSDNEKPQDYTQLFHLSEHMSVVRSSDQETLLAIAETGYFVRIRQCIPSALEIYCGRTENQPLYGHISRSVNQLEDITTLCYRQTGKDTQFVTLITIEDKDGMVTLKSGHQIPYGEIVFDKKTSTLICPQGGDFVLCGRERFRITAETEILSDSMVQVTAQPQEKCTYAYYLTNMETGNVIYRGSFSPNPVFQYDLKGQTQDVLVKLYVQSCTYPQRKSAIVSALVYDKETGQYSVDEGERYPFLNFRYYGHRVEKLSENEYQFTVDYDYSWNTKQRWYVYRNGNYHSLHRTSNQNTFCTTFQEPGEYTVLYYVRTSNGDHIFRNFQAIPVD